MNARLTQFIGGLLQSDLALRLVQNEALMRAMLKTFSMSLEVRQAVEAQLRGLLGGLDLARRDEVEALRREVNGLRSLVTELESRLEALLDTIEQAQAEADGLGLTGAETLYGAWPGVEPAAATAAKPTRTGRAAEGAAEPTKSPKRRPKARPEG